MRALIVVLVLMLVLLLGALPCAAKIPEIPRFRIVGPSDGLPSTMVVAIHRDRAGYLWLGTLDGLVRYDGAGFRTWRHDPNDPASLPCNAVQALHIDALDRIWIGCGKTLSVMDAGRRQFRHYRTADYPLLKDGEIYSIAAFDGDIWAGTTSGALVRIDAGGTMSSVDLGAVDGDLDQAMVMNLAADNRQRLWIATSNGLAYYDGKHLRREYVPDEPNRQSAIFGLQWTGDRLWLGSESGLHVMGSNDQWQPLPWGTMFGSGNEFWGAVAAQDGEFWLGSGRGLWRTRGERPPVPAFSGEGPLSRRNVVGLLGAADGGLWVPMHGTGLGYLPADWKRSAVLKPAAPTGDAIYCNLAPATRSGGLWQVDTDGRLLRVDPSTGDTFQTGLQSPHLKGMELVSALEDRLQRVWLGNLSFGLSRMDLRTGEFIHWPSDGPEPASALSAPDWIIEQGDTVWMAFLDMVQQRDLRSGRVLQRITQQDLHGLSDIAVQQLEQGPDGRVWAAGEGGMFAWDDTSRRFVPVAGLEGTPIQAFASQSPETVWVYRATGAEQWKKTATGWTRVRHVGEADGLAGFDASAMQIDPHGRVWISSLRGLWRIDPSVTPARLRNIGTRDGLTSQEFVQHCLLMAGDTLIGATSDGSTVLLDTAMPDIAPFVPALQLEHLSVLRNGARIALPMDRPFQLGPGDRQLQIVSRLLSYSDPLSNRYRSFLKGFDTEWQTSGNAGIREFASLPAGNYELALQGVDPLGNRSQVRTLRFTVNPPWWRSDVGIALICLLGLLLSALLAAAYRRRVRMRAQWQLAQHKRELAEQASQAKTRFLATLGHEVRTPMTGVLGMSELLLQTPLDGRQQGYASAIQSAGKHLLRLVNDALDLARIEAGKLPLDYRDFDLRQLIRQVAELVRPTAEQKQLVFECELEDALPPALHGDASRVQQILLNLLFNAVKFTEHGNVSLRVSVLPQGHKRGIRMEVRDTGPGMSAEQRGRLFQRFEQAEGALTLARHGGSGLGLAICRELAAAMGGEVTVSSELGRGACFVVELPLRWVAALPAVTPNVARTTPLHDQAPLQLLLVEDDPTVAQVIVGLLQTRGHQVTHVLHGLAALAEVSTRSFDAGLCDLDLPGIDGAALVAQLRARGVRFPIVAVTARADADAEPQAMAAGCNGFLRKPVTGDLLAQVLARALADASDAQEDPVAD
ncbi:ATP-binding protein [Xanthomonas hortorum pv. cynarae]|uniref:hybrid sensor histidine kinase/response regulator n=1 Tax=Xanthomonas hortorum TaxID=56454 RepID=UPI000CEDBB63|nr:hybrid sensor histidine kinase/response regulator [Xanthomonas hortorum]MCC4625655.1 response regulator [Xanthomonas campestris pv. nigromaculans]MCE4350047.1 ATP-binding protein [Xanthomonas hortorum pv. cynarae]PPU49156.1 hybrid sensor histidine kinase/response regulator [Xanthomonas hortorum pv. cynarae]CAD0316849.1 Sensor histidine kinase RcsC [Xanthomonas hortorum pv. cynarae]CAD0316854.1 Sensor histidine kinase RcsC [Xanthomonas hortorum pv. cynarae]